MILPAQIDNLSKLFPYSFIISRKLIVMLSVSSILFGVDFFYSETSLEYSKILPFFSTSVTIIYMYIVLIWKAPAIYEFIEHIGKIMKKREFRKYTTI